MVHSLVPGACTKAKGVFRYYDIIACCGGTRLQFIKLVVHSKLPEIVLAVLLPCAKSKSATKRVLEVHEHHEEIIQRW